MENRKAVVSEHTAERGKAVVSRKKAAVPTARRSASEITSLKIVTKKNDGEKKPFPWTTVITAVCLTVMFLFMMMNYIELDTLSDQVEDQNTVINNLCDEREKLEDKLAKEDNLDEIARYAENELGMVKKESANDAYYIEIKTDDNVQINRYEDENENGLGVLLTGAGNIIKSFFGS